MEQQFNIEVLLKLKRKKRRKIWRRILSVMMCIVVFCTTYMLILPAITKESGVFCGFEEHIHQDNCYREVLLCQDHVHTEACYTPTENLICTEPDTPPHSHSDSCYQAQAVLVCQEAEGEAHAHTEGCYEIQPVLLCTESTEPVHTHTEACYEITQQLSCTLENTPEHVHTEACRGKVLTCALEEHSHSISCFSDPTADVENESIWTAGLPELTGVYAEDVLAIARSQLGYAESTENYIVNDQGKLKGYTRYGDWYGLNYGDWCAMFVSFCLHYADVEGMPLEASCPNWVEKLQEMELYQIPSEYIPKAGDLIFFDWEADDSIDHVGLVEGLEELEVVVIEGNSRTDSVSRNKYELHDKAIAGYGILVNAPIREEQVQPQPSPELRPEDTDAWAELIPPEASPVPTEEQEADEPVAFTGYSPAKTLASPYSMRRGGTARAGTPLDLTPFINAVSMYDSNGNYIPSGTVVTEGDLIEFRIDYTIAGQKLAYLNGENMTLVSNSVNYRIPANFQVVKDSSGNIYNSQKQVVGSYEISSADGMIYMTFNDDYVEQNANNIAISGKVSFYSTVVKITDEDGEEQDYTFTDEITLGIIIQEDTEVVGSLHIEKGKASVDGEEIIYEIIVSSDEGTNGSITITDKMSTGLTFLEGISVRKNNGTSVSGARFSPAADGSSFTMTLPEMASGDSYIIRYRCKADMDLLGSDMTVRNTATVTGKDSHENELKDEATVDHHFDVLSKSGELNDDGSITWTIVVNRAEMDISGWILEDILRTGNQNTPYTGTVTISDLSGRVLVSSTHLPYTFPAGSTGTYVVTYTTDYDFGDGQTIYNSAILRDDDTDVTVLTGVDIGSPFAKTGEAGELFQDADGTHLLPITWTITIDTTGGPIPGGLYFQDRLEGYPSDDSYMTYEQLMAALESIESEIIRVSGQEVEGFSATVFEPGVDRKGETYNIIQLWANEDNCQSFKFERFAVVLADRGIPEGNILTFTYEAYGIFPNNVITSATFANRFAIAGYDELESRVNFTGGEAKLTKYAIANYDPNANNPDWFWNSIHWNGKEGTSQFNYDQLHNDYLAWAIELSVPPNYLGGDVTIIEDLPDSVNVKGMEMVFNSDVPVERLQWTELVVGQTYTITETILPADQHGTWNPQGAFDVTFTVTVTEEGDLEIVVPGGFLRTMAQHAVLNNNDEWFGHIYIYTQIKEDYPWTPSGTGNFVYFDHFENRYTMFNEYGDVVDIGSQTQDIRKDESKSMIRKDVEVEDGILNYSVLLNTYGRDLVPHSGTIHVLDTLTYSATQERDLRLRLIAGTVKLYKAVKDASGNYVKGQLIQSSYLYNENSVDSGGSINWTHLLELDVPDGQPLILEYSYAASGDKNAIHEVHNACSIGGEGQGIVDGDHKLELEVKDSTAEANIDGITIYKVDANDNGLYLQGAQFHIYMWNDDQQQYIPVHHPNDGDDIFVTNMNGLIALDKKTVNEDQFAYNTAYYIQEFESPNGYYLGPEKFYFYIIHENTQMYPTCMPDDFEGQALVRGDIIYRDNVSEFTRIRVEKYWLDHKGNPMTVTDAKVSSITLELWQRLEGTSGSDKLYGTYTMTPDADGNWNLVIENLPKATKNPDGTKGTNYLYYIKEVSAGGFILDTSVNNAGINIGTIKLTNRELEGYTLPETGGAGIHLYTTAGLLLMLASAAYLVYIFTHRRREAQRSS